MKTSGSSMIFVKTFRVLPVCFCFYSIRIEKEKELFKKTFILYWDISISSDVNCVEKKFPQSNCFFHQLELAVRKEHFVTDRNKFETQTLSIVRPQKLYPESDEHALKLLGIVTRKRSDLGTNFLFV